MGRPGFGTCFGKCRRALASWADCLAVLSRSLPHEAQAFLQQLEGPAREALCQPAWARPEWTKNCCEPVARVDDRRLEVVANGHYGGPAACSPPYQARASLSGGVAGASLALARRRKERAVFFRAGRCRPFCVEVGGRWSELRPEKPLNACGLGTRGSVDWVAAAMSAFAASLAHQAAGPHLRNVAEELPRPPC